MKAHVSGQCAQEFDSPLLGDTISSLEEVIMGWLGHVYGAYVTVIIWVRHLRTTGFLEVLTTETGA